MCAYKKAVPKIEIRISHIVEIISDLKDQTGDDDDGDDDGSLGSGGGVNETVLMNVDGGAPPVVAAKQSIATLNIKVSVC